MPIKITDGLSAKELLHEEGIFTIDKGSALRQDIRPLRILILNLMPLKNRRSCSSSACLAIRPSRSK